MHVTAVALLVVASLAACEDKPKPMETAEVSTAAPSMHTPISPPQGMSTSTPSEQRQGKVVEVINKDGYTYVQVDSGDEKVWAVAPTFQVKVNDTVTMPEGSAIKNYHSETLNRTFDVVYFVAGLKVAGAEQAKSQLPSGHPGIAPHPAVTPTPTGMSFAGIARPEGGKTIAEMYAEKGELAGKQVTIRGKVVKFNGGIMGKNWLHLKDGTGVKGSDDLTVTTSTTVKLGDTVLVRGMVVTDKDFGFGYKYPLLIDNAKVTVE